MYISSVSLNNFRCYRRTETTFVHRGAADDLPEGALNNVTLLIGTNGSGKTSVLRGVALAVLAPVINESGYRPYYLVRRPRAGKQAVESGSVLVDGVLDERESAALTGPLTKRADDAPDLLRIRVELARRKDYDIVQFTQIPGFRTRDEVSTAISRLKQGDEAAFVYNSRTGKAWSTNILLALDEYYSDFSPSFFLLGYGATRRVEEPRQASLAADKSRGRRYLRTAGLFEEAITLLPLAAWLPQLKKTERYKEIVRLLNRTLPAGTRFTGRFHPDHQPLFTHEGVTLPFPALSDGYRSYIGLLGDILSHVHDCCPKGRPLTELTGVVMVDDIDLHLHPKWQRVVIPRLAKALPKLQWIVTTHSPLVAGTVHAANVRVIGKNKVHQFAEQLHGLSVDQILSSPYFGYTKPRSDAAEKKLKKLLEGPIDTGDAEPALQFLKALAGNDPAEP
jgi:hypothetical protein